MTMEECGAALQAALARAAFDFRNPSPPLAWAVFKEFASDPTVCSACPLGVSFSSWWLDFYIEFRLYSKADEWYCETVTLTHYIPTPGDKSGLSAAVIYSTDFPDRQSFFLAVETNPEFRKGLVFER